LHLPLLSLLSPAVLPKAAVAAEARRQRVDSCQLGSGGSSLAIPRHWRRRRRRRQQQVAAVAFVSIVIAVAVIVAILLPLQLLLLFDC